MEIEHSLRCKVLTSVAQIEFSIMGICPVENVEDAMILWSDVRWVLSWGNNYARIMTFAGLEFYTTHNVNDIFKQWANWQNAIL